MHENLVILSGSPRKGATTDRLTAAFMEGAKAAGHDVTCFRVAGLNIGGCLGCGHCTESRGACIQQDDMAPVLDALRKATVLVLASPVYYFGVTAQLKLAIDRTYALYREDIPVRKAALLMTCGDSTDEAAEPSIAMFRKICSLLQWEEAGIVVAPDLHQPDEIDGREELALAKQLGREL